MANYIKNVAIVGAGGHSGKYMVEALLATGRHHITAITRHDSQTELPNGIDVKKVNYDEQSSLVEALRGMDALIITMSGFAPKEQQEKLIRAAADANVAWILPNEWSPDTANPALVEDIAPFAVKPTTLDLIKKLGGSSYIAVVTGFWYQWMLAMPLAFGFDFAKREATLFDDGETKTCVSTFAQIGRAVAGLLSLPIQPDGGNSKEQCLEHFRNQHVYVRSFVITQNEMLESALRVTGSKAEDWNVVKQPSRERYQQGIDEMKQGVRMAMAKAMATRVFFQDDSGNFEKTKGTLNKLLNLPEENLDAATAEGIEFSKKPPF